MLRLFSFACVAGAAALGVLSAVAGCGSADLEEPFRGDASVHRDAAPVGRGEAGAPIADGGGPAPSCEKYCDLVMSNCEGDSAQYASTEACLAFCAHLPLVQPTRQVAEKEAASVACRQYWAGGPARTNPKAYCLAAGPFGGNACGDRCMAFCDVVLSACPPDAGGAPYASQPECATACAALSYLDEDADGGGEGPGGPTEGDSLNCRLYWLRAATTDPSKCSAIGPQGDRCQD